MLLIAAFVAIIVLNPGEVDFRPTHIHSFRPMLGVLLIVAFCAGALLALFGGSLRSISAALANWRARRAARQAAQAGEWHRTGEQLAWDGEIERSRALLKKAWKRQPGNGAAALALASSYMDTGEYARRARGARGGGGARRQRSRSALRARRGAAPARRASPRRSACWRRCACSIRARRAC